MKSVLAIILGGLIPALDVVAAETATWPRTVTEAVETLKGRLEKREHFKPGSKS